MDPPPTEISTLSHTTLFRSPDRRGMRGVRRKADEPGGYTGPRAAIGRGSCAVRRPARAVVGPRSDRRLARSEEHTSELQSRPHLVCRLLLEKKKKKTNHRDP